MLRDDSQYHFMYHNDKRMFSWY